MDTEPIVIDFQKMGGVVHSGRAKGELTRERFNLDKIDKEQRRVIVRIPESTYSVTTSFFLGLFGKSIRQAGSREAFLARYEFQIPQVFRDTFDSCVSRALQEHRPLVRAGSKLFNI